MSCAKTIAMPPPTPALGPRLLDLLLDGALSLETFVGSRIAGLPYSTLRESLQLDETERAQLFEAAQRVAKKHLDGDGGAALFFVALIAAQAQRLDALMAGEIEPPADARDRNIQLVFGLLLISLPLLVIAAIYLIGKWSEKK